MLSTAFAVRFNTGILLICGLLYWPNSVTGTDDETLDSVLSFWRKREEGTKSYRFELRNEHVIGKGGPEGFKEDVTTLECQTITVDSAKLRNERSGEMWTATKFVPQIYVTVNDGEVETQLFDRSKEKDTFPSSALIRKPERHIDRHGPLDEHFRPFAKEFGAIDDARLRIIDPRATLNEVKCIVLEHAGGATRWRRLWVAPEQGMSIVRMVYYFGENVSAETDVRFKQHAKHGWIPDEWTIKRYRNPEKELIDSRKCKVIEFEINIPIDADTFQIELPVGTEAYDHRTKKAFTVKPRP